MGLRSFFSGILGGSKEKSYSSSGTSVNAGDSSGRSVTAGNSSRSSGRSRDTSETSGSEGRGISSAGVVTEEGVVDEAIKRDADENVDSEMSLRQHVESTGDEVEDLDSKIKSEKETLDEAIEIINSEAKGLGEIRSEISDLEGRIEDIVEILDRSRGKVGGEEFSKLVEAYESEYNSIVSEIEDLKSKVTRLRELNSKKEKIISEVQEEDKREDSEFEDLMDRLETVEDKQKSISGEFEQTVEEHMGGSKNEFEGVDRIE